MLAENMEKLVGWEFERVKDFERMEKNVEDKLEFAGKGFQNILRADFQPLQGEFQMVVQPITSLATLIEDPEIRPRP